jgi:hypothetical protein
LYFLIQNVPPTINNPVGINAKYYRGDEVNFTMGVSDRHSGLIVKFDVQPLGNVVIVVLFNPECLSETPIVKLTSSPR